VPQFGYVTPDGAYFTREFPSLDHAPRFVTHPWAGRGKRTTPHKPLPVSVKSKGWPIKSSAVGCNPNQVDGFYQRSVDRGVPTEFDRRDGDAVFTSPSHQRKYLKSIGFRNLDSYY